MQGKEKKFECLRCGLCCVYPLLIDSKNQFVSKKSFLSRCPQLELPESPFAVCRVHDQISSKAVCQGFRCDYYGQQPRFIAFDMLSSIHVIDAEYLNWLMIYRHNTTLKQLFMTYFFCDSRMNDSNLKVLTTNNPPDLETMLLKISRLQIFGYFRVMAARLDTGWDNYYKNQYELLISQPLMEGSGDDLFIKKILKDLLKTK